VNTFVLNSQLWGELQPVVIRKGLQPVALSLCGFPTCLLFPVIAICMSILLEYSMPEFELNVQGFGTEFHSKLCLQACGLLRGENVSGDTPHPGKGLRPLHSFKLSFW
jgi:hypothetical protein